MTLTFFRGEESEWDQYKMPIYPIPFQGGAEDMTDADADECASLFCGALTIPRVPLRPVCVALLCPESHAPLRSCTTVEEFVHDANFLENIDQLLSLSTKATATADMFADHSPQGSGPRTSPGQPTDLIDRIVRIEKTLASLADKVQTHLKRRAPSFAIDKNNSKRRKRVPFGYCPKCVFNPDRPWKMPGHSSAHRTAEV